MVTHKIGFLCCAFLLGLMGLAGTSFAYTYTWVYNPDKDWPFNYWDCSEWSDELVPYTSGGGAGANQQSGALGVYAAAWIGGGTSEAWQYIRIDVPTRSSIKATVKYIYVGGTINYGSGSFSGTEWLWRLGKGSVHRHDIDAPFSWDIVLDKVIDIIFEILGEVYPEGKIADAIEAIIGTVNQGGCGRNKKNHE